MASTDKTRTPGDLTRLFLALIMLVIFIWVPMRLAAAVPLESSDFFTFWLAGKLNLLGMYPYDPQDWAKGHWMFGVTDQHNPTFLYPLPMAVVLAPLGLMTLRHAYIVWTFLTLLMMFGGIWILLHTFTRTCSPKYLLPVLAAAALFRPVIDTLFGGQLSGFFFLVISLAALALDRHAWFRAGLLIGVLALKPNIGAPFILLAGLWLLSRRSWPALGGMLTTGVVLLLIGFISNPSWVADFFAVGSHKFHETFGLSSTIWGISSGICGLTPACTVYLGGPLVILLLIGTVLLLIQSRVPVSTQFALALISCTSLLATPYLWPYDQTLLILPILYVMAHLLERKAPYLLVATLFIWIALFAMMLLVVTIHVEMEIWNGFLSLSCFLLVVAAPPLRRGIPIHPGARHESQSTLLD